MDKTSIIIPARNEQFLIPTVKDLVNKAKGEIEVIVMLEGYWPEHGTIFEHPSVNYVHFPRPRGMRGAITAGVNMARGKYVMKCDAHCMFGEGYDEILKADLDPDWIAVPRRYSLDPENWDRKPKKHIDYLYLCYPVDPNDRGGASLHGRVWAEWNNDPERSNLDIDDLMSAQGSCWFMHRDYFHTLELLDESEYGTFGNEFQEIGLKCWLSGGRVIRNKKTWYAHLHKGRKYGRGYGLSHGDVVKAATKTRKWMDGRNWHGQDRDVRWLVKKFWPVPGWPATSVNLVFHRRRGGSGEIRGRQISEYLKARCNPEWTYPDDVHIWVKQQPPDDFPARSYLDVLDGLERVSWLLKHPEIGVIASSRSGHEYLQKKLGRDDIIFIPQHHCNYERVRRERDTITVAGVVGGRGAVQCDIEELERRLAEIGVEFRWMQRYTNREEVAEFYKGIDVQIVWRNQDRSLKNPLKIINAMSFGIPTMAKPEQAYLEVLGFYWPINSIDEIVSTIQSLREGFNGDALIERAEEYHIENVSQLYSQLLGVEA